MVEQTLEQLASKHLGKAGDGTVVAPYVSPDKHDNTLLVPIPRALSRVKSKIDTTIPSVGFEAWHAYEMSFLKLSGMPVTGILKLSYSSASEFMIESKSLKLYLNSFDLERFESMEEVEDIIREDLSEALNTEVAIKIHPAHEAIFNYSPFDEFFENVDELDVEITSYKEDISVLDSVFHEEGPGTLTFHTANLRSNCEITNQKDSGNSYIYMVGAELPSKEALLKYIISFREVQAFHENTTELIYSQLYKRYAPEELLVADIYCRRGGIDIHSIRATSEDLIDDVIGEYYDVDLLFKKTVQQ